MKRYLIVIHNAEPERELWSALEQRLGDEPGTLHVLAVATPPPSTWTYTDGAIRATARRRLERTAE